MRFQVPQFIETENKIVGPFSVRQFAYIGSGGLLIFVFRYIFTTFTYFVMASIIVGAIALGLAFAKIDGIPLPNFLFRATMFGLGIKKYIFTKEQPGREDLTDIERVEIKH
jgi:hypothetical protein